MDQKIEILSQEREKMRDESISLGQRIHKTIIIYFTIAIAIIGLSFKENIFPSKNNLEIIVFFLSQIEFFLAILCITIISNQHVHAGYLQAIETKINVELKSKLLIWENHITKKFLYGSGSAFYFGTVLYTLIFTLIFVYMIYLFAIIYDNYYISFVLFLEMILAFFLIKKQQADQKNTYKYAIEKIDLADQVPACKS